MAFLSFGGEAMKAWMILPLIVAGVLAVHYFGNRGEPPVPQGALVAREPGEDLSGMWAEVKSSALLRLKHGMDDRLSGEYVPPGDRPIICRFSGMVQGQEARFDLKLNRKMYHCVLENNGGKLTLKGRKDVDALFKDYAMHDRMPSGVLIISPRNPLLRLQDQGVLTQKRNEIRRAGREVTTFGTFVRIEGEGGR
jgi:hypothetical protein